MKSYTNTRAIKVYDVSKHMSIRVHTGNIVTYKYYVNEDMQFEFGLLSEVGEMWQRIFKRYISFLGLKIETVDEPDYYGERIVYV